MSLTIFKRTSGKSSYTKASIIRLSSLLVFTIYAVSFVSCSDNNENDNPEYQGTTVDLETHKLMAYTVSKKSKYLVVFESGHGNDHTSWYSTGKSSEILSISNFLNSDVLLYDRAGYGKSGSNTEPRDINKLRIELEKVIDQFANNRKVILVGHSLGGLIIRDYAIKNPSKVGGLLFVDATHEKYNHFSQEQIDLFYATYKTAYGANSGIALETLELIEDLKYMSGLPNLPDVPVIAITSMKTDAEHNAADRQLWYESKEFLKSGVTDFTQIATVKSGHFIQLEEPNLVLGNIKLLLSKLP
ncbi:alpha/beta fold hydrolase [Flavobacterium sp. MDT1-60]|uniref:alpha/beta fold hydrolase n=1 Tax=Flavobacterium sp. MDT1-60 TaxID=1979344 RepID=UPI0017820BD7|nr:alpha/beta fold hydrolase [Flavobacterium sp. MDT1-60]QOG02132.1 alpha/beta fold hydrolase [Flavobacterium sp. MDT1-60]